MGRGIVISVAPAIVLFVVFYLVPLGTLLVTAFSDWSFLGFSWVGVRNFSEIAHDARFWHAVENTLLYSAAGTLIQVPLGVLAGVLLARRPAGWRIWRAALFLPVVISGAAFALAYTMFYNPEYGLLNTMLGWFGIGERDWLFGLDTALPAVAATYVFIVGLVMILVMAEIAAIPKELYEAAEVDGANRLQRERYVTLPALRHIVGTCVLLTLLGTLKLFDVVYIMTAGGPGDRTSTLGTYAYDRYINDRWGYANAVGVVTILIGFAVIVSVRRAFRIGERDE
jgi:raffinose/stachyose/melibiose transport system permease protein